MILLFFERPFRPAERNDSGARVHCSPAQPILINTNAVGHSVSGRLIPLIAIENPLLPSELSTDSKPCNHRSFWWHMAQA